MNDELSMILDRYEQFAGRLHEKHGFASELVKESRRTVRHLKKFNGKLLEFQKALNKKKRKSRGIASRTQPGTSG